MPRLLGETGRFIRLRLVQILNIRPLTLRKKEMGHNPNIPLVDAHPERRGCHHDTSWALHEDVLRRKSLAAVEFAVVELDILLGEAALNELVRDGNCQSGGWHVDDGGPGPSGPERQRAAEAGPVIIRRTIANPVRASRMGMSLSSLLSVERDGATRRCKFERIVGICNERSVRQE